MRVEENCKYGIDVGLSSRFWEHIECYTRKEISKSLSSRYSIVRVDGVGGQELLLVPSYVLGIVDINSICDILFTLGLHVASVRNSRLRLNLAAGQLIEKAVNRGYIVLPEQLVKKLLYGKEITISTRCLDFDLSCNPVAILDSERDFVAWARVLRAGGKLLIKPLIDAGWYLRSGV